MSDLSGAARDAANTARNVARDAANTARDATDKVQQQGERLYRQTADEAERQAARLADVIRDQPMVSAVAALAIGFVVGRLLNGNGRR